MKIIGLTIDSISAEKKKVKAAKLQLQNNLSITNISEDKVEFFDKPVLRFDFLHSINYEPGLAEVKVIGTVLALGESEEVKNILKDWKNKKFEHDSKILILNYIVNECLLKMLNLEKEIGLPPHIPFPRLKKDSKSQSSQNSSPANYTG